MLNRLAWFIGTLLVSGVIIILLAQYMLPKFGSFNKFVLKGFEQEGYIAGESSLDLPQPGVVGKSLTPLKPAGKIIVQEKIYDALSNGTFIEAGESIMIARLEGSVVVVISHSENSI
jgi:membrane-bound ClpP family serine protease